MQIGLGTAQFGSKYGISNKAGAPNVADIKSIVDRAYQGGINLVDTAPAYGNSEKIIGEIISAYANPGFKVVTKTPVFNESEISRSDVEMLESIFENSKVLLKQGKIYALLVHHCDDIFKPNGAKLYDRMVELKKTGQVEKIGASVYTAEQIDRLLDHYPVDIIQVPVNVFDQRLIQCGYLKKIKKQGIEIHVRSVFLQGLLLMKPEELPTHLHIASKNIKQYRTCIELKGISPIQAALNFIFKIKEVDYAIVGVNEEKEINEVIDAVNNLESTIDYSAFALNDENILNPALWT